MEYYDGGVKLSPALSRALIEIRLIQRERLKKKMTDQFTIGDAKVTYVVSANSYKTYNGTVVIERIGNDFEIFLRSGGKRLVMVPCGQIVNRSIQKAMVILQLAEDYIIEKCSFEFYSEEEAQMFTDKLPPIARPLEHNNSSESSDSDFDDSGNEKTENFKENLFDADNPSEE